VRKILEKLEKESECQNNILLTFATTEASSSFEPFFDSWVLNHV